jgi:TPR repeat protein
MRKALALGAGILLALLAARLPAAAGHAPSGLDGVQVRKGLVAFDRRDYARAGLLLHGPAERGNASAQAVLCFLYAYGRGVPLGLLYSSGHGVPENYVQAYKWLNLAAAQASSTKRDFSYRIRDSVVAKMSPRQVAKAQALTIAWRPIPEGYGAPLAPDPCAYDASCVDH